MGANRFREMRENAGIGGENGGLDLKREREREIERDRDRER